MSGHVEVDDALWDEFHRVVNMASREKLPDQSGSETGRSVLGVLQKRRVDLTDDDERVMRNVVDRVHAERREDLEPTAGHSRRHHDRTRKREIRTARGRCAEGGVARHPAGQSVIARRGVARPGAAG